MSINIVTSLLLKIRRDEKAETKRKPSSGLCFKDLESFFRDVNKHHIEELEKIRLHEDK